MFQTKKEELVVKVEEDKNITKNSNRDARMGLLPTFNPEATVPAHVYDINSVVEDRDLEAINISALFVAITKKPENLTQSHYSAFTNGVLLENME
jgi:hypothetical protein